MRAGEVNFAEARAMFRSLYGSCEGLLEIRALPGGSDFFPLEAISDDRAWPHLVALLERRSASNCYFGVATRDGNGGGKANIIHQPSVYIDLDFKLTPSPEIKTCMERFPYRPSIVVMSGGGYHLYWVLNEPVGHEDIPNIEIANRRIAHALGGDMAATDASRILRIPGTRNHKRDRTVQLKHLRDFRYDLADFDDLPDPGPKEESTPGGSVVTTDATLLAVFSCRFLRWAYEQQHAVSEPLWYAMLSNVCRLSPGGITLAHMFSSRHPTYSHKECAGKILHTLDGAGPHSCRYIRSNGFDNCGNCRATTPLKLILRRRKGK